MNRPRWRKQRVWLLVVNATSYTAGPFAVTRIVRRVRRMRRPSVVLWSEALDVRLEDLVDPTVWQVIQYGDLEDSEAGCALMLRRSKARSVDSGLFLASGPGETIDARWAVEADVEIKRAGQWVPFSIIVASHVPPRRAPNGQHTHAAKLADVLHFGARPMIVGGDWNMPRAEVAARTGVPIASVRMVDVLGVAGRGVRFGRARGRRVRSDHPGAMIPVILDD